MNSVGCEHCSKNVLFSRPFHEYYTEMPVKRKRMKMYKVFFETCFVYLKARVFPCVARWLKTSDENANFLRSELCIRKYSASCIS